MERSCQDPARAGGEGRRDSSESQCFSPASAQIPRKIPITRAANPVRIGARKSSGWSGPSHRSRRSGRDESDQAANRSDNCPFTFKDPGRSPKDRRRNTPVRGREKETARIPPINWQFSTGDPNPRNYKTQTRGKHNNNPARIGRGSGGAAEGQRSGSRSHQSFPLPCWRPVRSNEETSRPFSPGSDGWKHKRDWAKGIPSRSWRQTISNSPASQQPAILNQMAMGSVWLRSNSADSRRVNSWREFVCEALLQSHLWCRLGTHRIGSGRCGPSRPPFSGDRPAIEGCWTDTRKEKPITLPCVSSMMRRIGLSMVAILR